MRITKEGIRHYIYLNKDDIEHITTGRMVSLRRPLDIYFVEEDQKE